MAKDYDKEALIADKKLGMTNRELAHKYKVSVALVGKLTKGISDQISKLVIKQVEVNQELKTLNDKEVIKFNKEVIRKEMEIDFLDNVVIKNIQAVSDYLDQGICTPQDLKANADTLDKSYVSLRHAPRHSNQSVNVQTNVQNNTMSDLIKETTGKVLRPS